MKISDRQTTALLSHCNLTKYTISCHNIQYSHTLAVHLLTPNDTYYTLAVHRSVVNFDTLSLACQYNYDTKAIPI